MKKYIEPALRTINLEAEEGILTGSDLNAHNHMFQGEGEDIGEQFTNQKDPDLWGNESIWK